MSLCYYLYYCGRLLCIIKEVISDEIRELQMYMNQGGGEVDGQGVGRGGGGSNNIIHTCSLFF